MSRNKNIYIHNGSRNIDKNANNIDHQEDHTNEHLDNKIIVMRERNNSVSTPNKRVQVVVPSGNINRLTTEEAPNNKSIHHASNKIIYNESQYFSAKGKIILM